jgi:hypothetical protein
MDAAGKESEQMCEWRSAKHVRQDVIGPTSSDFYWPLLEMSSGNKTAFFWVYILPCASHEIRASQAPPSGGDILSSDTKIRPFESIQKSGHPVAPGSTSGRKWAKPHDQIADAAPTPPSPTRPHVIAAGTSRDRYLRRKINRFRKAAGVIMAGRRW